MLDYCGLKLGILLDRDPIIAGGLTGNGEANFITAPLRWDLIGVVEVDPKGRARRLKSFPFKPIEELLE
jgi:hypothetical protein